MFTEQKINNLSYIFASDSILSTAQTICKMTRYILFHYRGGKTAYQIRNYIMTEFELEFTPEEIIDAIRYIKDSAIKVEFDETQTDNIDSYTFQLSVAELHNYNGYQKEDRLQNYVDRFCQANEQYEGYKNKLSNCISKHIYNTFNSNFQAIKNMFVNHSYVDIFEKDNNQFTLEEKQAINTFLEWDNPAKNKYIADIMSIAYNYCLVNAKASKKEIRESFDNTVFLLDTNIIYRLMGLNGIGRQETTQRFIDKCKDAGIKLIVSNFTKQELELSIKYNIKKLIALIDGHPPISYESMRALQDEYWRSDYYRSYTEWLSETGSNWTDFTKFQNYILKISDETINKLETSVFDSYKNKDPKLFNGKVNELYEFKQAKKQGYERRESAAIDIDNLYAVYESRKGYDRDTILDICMISADQYLILWAKENFVGVPTLVELPSVWMSILLQVLGRATDQEYSAFCRLIVLRYEDDEVHIKNGLEILNSIRALDASTELKEQIIYRLANYSERYELIVEIPKRVGQALDDIVNEKVSCEVGKAVEPLEQKMKRLQIEVHKKRRDNDELLKENYEKELASQQEESEKNAALNVWTKERIVRNKRIIRSFYLVAFMGLLMLLGIVLIAIFNLDDFINHSIIKTLGENTVLCSIITFILTTTFACLPFIIKKIKGDVLSTEYEVVNEHIVMKIIDDQEKEEKKKAIKNGEQ